MKNHLKLSLCLTLFMGCLAAHAGSYENFFMAAKKDDASTVSALIKQGFDVNTVSPAGESALLVAARESSLKVIAVLLKTPKIKVETRSAQDESPLMLAAINGLTEVCKQLIAADADVNKTGWTPLHYAGAKGHVEIIQLLLDNHAYIDAESPNRTTPLMMAASYGTPAAVQLLLSSGADPLLRNMQGMSALNFANNAARPDATQLLRAFLSAMPDRRIRDTVVR